MDLSTVSLDAFIAFMLVFIILMKVFQSRIVGFIGEKYTAWRVKRITGGIVFHDVYVKGSHGVQQIDIIAVTEKGILVIEKKTYIGLIVGSAYDKQWTVYIARGRRQFFKKRKYFMKNPHHQNYGHIQALYEAIPELRDKCIDLVIFGNNATLGDRIPEGTIYDSDFRRYYKSLPYELFQKEMKFYADKIENLNSEKAENKKMHKAKIKRL